MLRLGAYSVPNHYPHNVELLWRNFIVTLAVQSTPIISRQLGAKIRERELSGSPVISREGPNSRLAGSQSHILTSAPLKPKQYVER